MSRLKVNTIRHSDGSSDNITLDSSQNVTVEGNLTVDGTMSGVEGTEISSTGESGGSKYLREDGDGTCSWQTVAAGGVTHIDTWVLTTNFSGSQNIITSNLARSTAQNMSQLGTGVTESSGVFTLPTTGHWLIIFRCHIVITTTNDELHYEGGIRISTNSGTTFTLEAENKANIAERDASIHGSTLTTYIMDCTNTSTQKVGFDVRTNNSNTITGGHTDYDATYMRFIRLADT
tara:strand:- start:76 stop:774 length:699 start_codon:yes stop_codon:yes gene_type:complete